MSKPPQYYTSKPKNKKELQALIRAEIKKNGRQCDLNHIDVSLVTDFSRLFFEPTFNGELSEWDVSDVAYMDGVFSRSEFNGDLSGWDVSGVKNMRCMFYGTKFNGNISKWDVSRVRDMDSMFYTSEFKGDISGWNRFSLITDEDMFLNSSIAKGLGEKNPSFEQIKSYYENLNLEAGLQEASNEQVGTPKARL